MTSLNFGHRNAIQSTLRELALQIEEMRSLVSRPDDPDRIIPLTNVPSVSERERILNVLAEQSDAVREMTETLELEIEAIDVSHKLKSIIEYMKVIVKNVRPEHLRGYGTLAEQDKATMNSHVEKFLSLLNALY
jgi:hypothetical protein